MISLRTVRSLTFEPKPTDTLSGTSLKNSGGPSAHLGRTVREPTRDSASSLERSRTVRPSSADCPPAHQSLCKLSGTGADCPPLWCGLSAVTQSALELSLFQIFFKTPLALMHATRHFEQNGTKDPSSMSTQPLLIVRLSIQQIRSLLIH